MQRDASWKIVLCYDSVKQVFVKIKGSSYSIHEARALLQAYIIIYIFYPLWAKKHITVSFILHN